MTHDKFCPITIPHLVRLMCVCEVLAKVREDERRQAGIRVEAVSSWGDPFSPNPDRWVLRDVAAAAARGECEHRFVMHYADKAGQCDKCGAIDTDLDVIAQHAQPADPSTHAAATAEQGGERA